MQNSVPDVPVIFASNDIDLNQDHPKVNYHIGGNELGAMRLGEATLGGETASADLVDLLSTRVGMYDFDHLIKIRRAIKKAIKDNSFSNIKRFANQVK